MEPKFHITMTQKLHISMDLSIEKSTTPPPLQFRRRCNVDCVMCALSVAHFDVQTFS